jgi:hypothetical protein
MARQAALLLLYVHGCEIPEGSVTHDFCRQALNLDLRGKREFSTDILSAMGGINRFQFSRYKALLHLCDEAVELADRHGIEESSLRYLLDLSSEDQVEMIRQVVQLGLTRKQVRDLIEHTESKSVVEGSEISKRVLQLARIMKSIELPDARNLVSALLQQEADPDVVRARLKSLRRLVDEAENFLTSS